MIFKGNYEKYAFIDSYGDQNVNTDISPSTHFIIVSVNVKEVDLSSTKEYLEKIADYHFSGSEIKSSGVGRKDQRRLEILKSLQEIHYRFGTVIIDKRDIRKTSGLIYKRPFIKFCHNILLKHLFVAFPNICVLIDEHGSPEFMKGFKQYVDNQYLKPDLFTHYSINFVPSVSYRLIQLADFIAGTLARVYDEKKRSTIAKDFWEILKQHILWFDYWPPRYCYTPRLTRNSSDLNQAVSQQAIRSAVDFIGRNYDFESENVRAQVETAKYLLYANQYQDESMYVSADAIIEMLRETIGIIYVSKESFWRQVIEPLRDARVIIVSSRDGYKIPSCIEELLEFVKDVDRRVTPQVKRLNMIREQVRTATTGSIDILDEYDHLDAIIARIYGASDYLIDDDL